MSDIQETDVYKRLANHLNQLPTGFPHTDSGVELRILKRLFTPEEAAIAPGLVMKMEPASVIANRLNMKESELAPILETMSKKGLILRSTKNGVQAYMAAQFIIGIWEYHVNDLDETLIRDVNEYIPHLMKKSWLKQKTKQMRIIPISQSITAEMNIMPYEKAEDIIKAQSKIVVAPCICRKEHEMIGKGCKRPMETCLVLGGGAFYYEENGLGRDISQQEALDILHKGIEAGLVLQPGNSKKPMVICMCCGCCCQILKNLNQLDEPAKAVCSNYYAVVNEENCTACEICKERCQMNAITIDEIAHVNSARCIGCGLCVNTCEFGAMQLVEKDSSEKYVPPDNMARTYMNLAKERGVI
jgi:Pyruvate/2-oxoacid:ferredoxin oxidoreductase delta subunit